MLKRIITGAAILLITVAAVLLKQFSNLIFDAFLLVLSYGALYEVIKAYKFSGKKIDLLVYIFPALFCAIFIFVDSIFKALGYVLFASLVYLSYLLSKDLVCYAIARKKTENYDLEAQHATLFDGTKFSLMVLIYPVLVLSMFFALNHISYALSYLGIVLAFAISMLTDTFALFLGMAFGKHKLAPEVSPGKTVEGMLGGLFGGLLGAACVYLFFRFTPYFSADVSSTLVLVVVLLLGLFGSLIDQLGDLIASALKRKVKVKDYGHIFPGHGGFMDRVDGLMFTASLIFIVFALFLV